MGYSPLGRGFLTGSLDIQKSNFDLRNILPRFQGENRISNEKLVNRLNLIAQKLNITSSQLALAWILNREDQIIPIPGTRKIKRVMENINAADIVLSQSTINELNQLFHFGSIKGNRYTKEGMKGINM